MGLIKAGELAQGHIANQLAKKQLQELKRLEKQQKQRPHNYADGPLPSATTPPPPPPPPPPVGNEALLAEIRALNEGVRDIAAGIAQLVEILGEENRRE